MFDTIVSLATPYMKGALAVIRISGDEALSITRLIFDKGDKIQESHRVYYGHIIDKEEIIDEVMVTYFKGPHSFTAEDVIEISCHGSMLIANQIIELVLAKGARLAEKGEFTSRAFYHGRIDLVQAEAVNDLINANSYEAKKLSLLSLKGDTSRLLDPIKTKLADILALIEVNIDYPEYEDIEEVSYKKIEDDVVGMCDQVKKLIDDGDRNSLIMNGINVAIIGKPNVGKSSLLNALLKEDKAIVTSIPGTTRDIVEGKISLKGITLNLLDTAGIRDSEDVVEKIGIEKSKQVVQNADLVLLIVDASKPLDQEDEELRMLCRDKKYLMVHNKSDLLDEVKEDVILISAKNKQIDLLKDKIIELFGLDQLNQNQPSLCSARELGLLKASLDNLNKALDEAKDKISLDLISVSLKTAYDKIKSILGEEVNIDLSEEIFSRFCVGK